MSSVSNASNSQPKQICRSAAPGFTLVELLVVVAIVAILASILFPVFAQAREKGRQAVCASNLRQIAMAGIAYSEDYDGTWPIARPLDSPTTNSALGEVWQASDTFTTASPETRSAFANAMYPYLKSWAVWSCPSGKDVNVFGEPESQLGQARFSYAYNAYLNVYPTGKVAQPANTALFFEMGKDQRWRKYMQVFPLPDQGGVGNGSCASHSAPMVPYQFCRAADTFWYYGSWETANYFSHQHGANMAYCDGHVKYNPAPSGDSLYKGYSGGGIPVSVPFRGRMIDVNVYGRAYQQGWWVAPLGPEQK